MSNAHLAPIFREAARKIAEHECTYVGKALYSVPMKDYEDADNLLTSIYGLSAFEFGAGERDERVMCLLFAAEFCAEDLRKECAEDGMTQNEGPLRPVATLGCGDAAASQGVNAAPNSAEFDGIKKMSATKATGGTA